MMTRPPETAQALVPPEVVSFASKEGVDQDVLRIVERTRRVFALGEIKLTIDGPEDDQHIRVEVCGTNFDDHQASKAQMVWTDEVFKTCPPSDICIFRLAVV